MLSLSHSHLPYLRAAITRTAFLTALVSTVACGRTTQVAPSALAANPADYDGQSVTVSGTVKNPTAMQMRRGTATTYQLCDNACITVIAFDDPNVSDGSQVTTTGRFRASFGSKQMMTNVLIVGGHMRGSGGAAALSPSP
jgi:hypothetical protein